jgi:ABC-type branched-subunit amino acid transport system permease subunit
MGALVDRDEEHLKLLKISYYVLAGMSGLFSLFPLLWVGFAGILMSGAIPAPSNSNGDPAQMALVFLSFGIAATILGLTLPILTFRVARNFGDRRHRTFCMVIAGLCCVQVPWALPLVFARL